ncbi:MAG: YARHG domain-containing protein [Bacteroidota bacterium]
MIRYCFLLAFLLQTSLNIAQGDFSVFIEKIKEGGNLGPEMKVHFHEDFPNTFGSLDEIYIRGEEVIVRAKTTFVICQLTDPYGLCMVNLLSAFDHANKIQKQELFNLLCQQDEMSEFFESSEYSFFNDSIIEVRTQNYVNEDLPGNEAAGEEPIYYQYFFLRDTEFSFYEKDRPEGKREDDRLDYRIFTKEMLEEYSVSELRILRNSIFARHGYRFKSKDLQAHFLAQSWYTESTKTQDSILKELNPIEKVNIQLIQEMEQKRK